MIDLIDRERLLNSRVYSTRSGKPNYEKMLKNLVNDILTTPTVEIERHAHWVEQADGNLPLCSKCLEECTFYKLFDIETETSECVIALTDFCPHCGCKMDEVEDETQNN